MINITRSTQVYRSGPTSWPWFSATAQRERRSPHSRSHQL